MLRTTRWMPVRSVSARDDGHVDQKLAFAGDGPVRGRIGPSASQVRNRQHLHCEVAQDPHAGHRLRGAARHRRRRPRRRTANDVSFPSTRTRGALAVILDIVRIVRDQDQRAVRALLEELDAALLVEAAVADRDHLVDQEAVELDHHREREGQARPHPARVRLQGLAQVPAQLRELLDERRSCLPCSCRRRGR